MAAILTKQLADALKERNQYKKIINEDIDTMAKMQAINTKLVEAAKGIKAYVTVSNSYAKEAWEKLHNAITEAEAKK